MRKKYLHIWWEERITYLQLNEQIRQEQEKEASIPVFLTTFEQTSDELPEFTLDAFITLTEFITVYSKKDIRVTFRNGREVQA